MERTSPSLLRGTADCKSAGRQQVPHGFRHISNDDQVRLEAAAVQEDVRSYRAMWSKAIAFPNVSKLSPSLSEPVRRCLVESFEANALSVLDRTAHSVPPRFQALLVLTLRAGLLVREAIALKSADVNEHTGAIRLLGRHASRKEIHLGAEHRSLLNSLRSYDAELPLLRLTPSSLDAGWARVCEAAECTELTLADLDFETKFRALIK